MASLACSFNIYNDANALPGMLENASQWADSIYCIHAGPGGKASNDGTMEILEKWGIRPVMADIMEGFGVIRSRLIHECGCDWTLLMDADERFPVIRPTMTCSGTEKFPEFPNPNLKVTFGNSFDQLKALKGLIECAEGNDAIVMPRYHFFDFTHKRPSQSFSAEKDFQCRCVRNVPHVGYKLERKLHEHIVDYRTGGEPAMVRQTPNEREVALFHYHNFFKPLEPAQNKEDLEIYRALSSELTKGMWLESAPMK